MYSFEIVSARNPPSDPARTLGVEVTDATVAVLCGAGNIDGQHGEALRHMNYGTFTERHGELARWDGRAAVDIAEREGIPLPVDERGHADVVFATTKPDVDSIAAMAVLVLKSKGLWPDEKTQPTAYAEARARVRLIAERDNFSPGGGWVPRPLPTEKEPWPAGAAPVEETEALAALGLICSPRPGQTNYALPYRVLVAACWLLWGTPPELESAALDAWGDPLDADVIGIACRAPQSAGSVSTAHGVALDLADASVRARVERTVLAHDVAEGKTKIRVGLGESPASGMYYEGDRTTLSLHEYESNYSYTGQQAKFAVVDYTTGGALGVGYCLAPVVIATGLPVEGGGKKYTIAAWSPKYVDFPSLLKLLNAAEAMAGGVPKWGGNLKSGIIGSPQTEGSVLTTDHVIQIVTGTLT